MSVLINHLIEYQLHDFEVSQLNKNPDYVKFFNAVNLIIASNDGIQMSDRHRKRVQELWTMKGKAFIKSLNSVDRNASEWQENVKKQFYSYNSIIDVKMNEIVNELQSDVISKFRMRRKEAKDEEFSLEQEQLFNFDILGVLKYR